MHRQISLSLLLSKCPVLTLQRDGMPLTAEVAVGDGARAGAGVTPGQHPDLLNHRPHVTDHSP